MSSTVVQGSQRFAERKHATLTTTLLILLFWIPAAIVVEAANNSFAAHLPGVCVILQSLGVLVAAFAYFQLTARDATFDHALLVGIIWLVLALGSEIANSVTGHSHYQLLGPPSHGALRNILLFVWVGAPALFARRTS